MEGNNQSSFTITICIVLGLQQNETWRVIKARLTKLLNLNSQKRPDYTKASEKLNMLISKNARENELRNFIKEYKLVLIPNPYDFQNVDVRTESSTSAGRSDILVIAQQEREPKKGKVYIWELKRASHAPFRYIKNNKRAEPTLKLIQAENQLLHYYYSLSKDEYFWETIDSNIAKEDVKFGGVIIGTDDNFANISRGRDKNHNSLFAAAKLARKLRQEYIYERNNMMLLTWSDIQIRLKTYQDYFKALLSSFN